MRLESADLTVVKGWYVGPWNSDLAVSVGWANVGIDAPHEHARMTEIFLVARGEATARVEQETISLVPGDVLILEPGEAHTFLTSTDDYFHFVIHTPALPEGEARADQEAVPRSRLGLA